MESGDIKKRRTVNGDERGIALLIVLLVTALLIALIFEFAYATRISMNSAVNFRDSQRAYFLARSGITAFKKYGQALRDIIPQGVWSPIPGIGEADTIIMAKWEDESGKIKINDIRNKATQEVVGKLFENKGIETDVVTNMAAQSVDIGKITLLSELRQYMSGDDFEKISSFLTIAPVSNNEVKINVNTAAADVLQSLGIDAYEADRIVKEGQSKPYVAEDLTSRGRLATLSNIKIDGLILPVLLKTQSSGFYKIYAYATVGGYTKQVEAILNGTSVSYWRAL